MTEGHFYRNMNSLLLLETSCVHSWCQASLTVCVWLTRCKCPIWKCSITAVSALSVCESCSCTNTNIHIETTSLYILSSHHCYMTSSLSSHLSDFISVKLKLENHTSNNNPLLNDDCWQVLIFHHLVILEQRWNQIHNQTTVWEKTTMIQMSSASLLHANTWILKTQMFFIFTPFLRSNL